MAASLHPREIEAERPCDIVTEMTLKRKRVHVEADAGCNGLKRDDADSNDDEVTITEEHYRSMVEEHAQKYRKLCLREAILARTTLTCAEKTAPVEGSANGSFMQVDRVDRDTDAEVTHPRLYSSTELTRHLAERQIPLSQKIGEDFEGQFPRVLDIGGIKFQIPSLYDRLAPALHLPDYSAVQIDERVFSGRIKSRSMVSVIASDRRAKIWKGRTGMGDASDVASRPKPGAYSERNAQDTQKKFSLLVLDPSATRAVSGESLEVPGMGQALDAFGPASVAQHGLSSSTLRHIASDGGLLRHCEVKVLEKGDGYEVIQRKVPRKEPAKIDLNVVAKEDAERFSRAWNAMIRKDLTKHHKAFLNFNKKQLQDAKRVAEACQREVRGRNLRSLRIAKAAPMRTRRLCRESVLHWKKVDKEQIEIRKKEEKDAAEALKRDEEMREARRQQQRLNFLLTQTELYSHFMQDKMAGAGTQAVKGSESTASTMGFGNGLADAHGPLTAEEAAEEETLKAEARLAAEAAVSQQKQKTNAFDSESVKLRLAAGADAVEQEMMQLDGAENIDLVNPSTMPTTSSVQQPRLFRGSLKDYQLKGLQWLVNCYEQGLNGILADEMGLGKTIQAMSFLAHLAEEKNIWGPFLVVAPASVLNNWADEVGRFCPELKILPYWGGLQERVILRKNINPKRLYRKDAGFHILITSYQLLVLDEKYFRRVKWQYMVLDEAQAIKSSTSLRWKTLLSFNCRNRLLLTGTPIQNSMAELWALLHFIMPTLFDSHEQFNEWFSKGIEGHAEHGGTLNEHQLSRLHSILKPFMLRRVKKDVITEMTNKKEVILHCDLSSRQQAFYQAIKNKISVSDLLDGGQLNEKKVLNLMNIVIQLRKVCNHPELFERNEGRSFVHFAATYDPLLPAPFGELEDIHYAGSRSPISFYVPKLLYRDGMRCLPSPSSGSAQGFYEKWVMNLCSIFSPENSHSSIFPKDTGVSGSFGFTRLLDVSPTELDLLAKATFLEQWLFTFWRSESAMIGRIMSERLDDASIEAENADSRTRAVQRLLMVPPRSASASFYRKIFTGADAEPFESLLVSCKDRLLHNLGLLRSVQAYMPPVRAPQIELICSDRGLVMQRVRELHDPWVKQWLVGLGRTTGSEAAVRPPTTHGLIQELDVKVKEQVQQPLLSLPYRIFGSAPPVQSFDFAKMLADSGKLKTLDALLKRLRAGNHRVLVFAQMTKMLNVLEDYMNFRKYKYLRLDGSSSIMDRRDMVKDFQLRSDIFVFLLSTRAGGLGINLTAADVVIFYESDWNPTMDLQAMDRAHRLGQTKEVTVYRLICKGTVEEKIMKRASQKNTVQQLVMTGGQSQGDVFAAEEVVSLLLDDAELEQRMQDNVTKQTDKQEKKKKGWGVGVKGVRLDDDGGASLDDERVVSDSPSKAFENGDPQSSAANGTVDLAAENGNTSGKKRRRGRDEGKPPRPPRKSKLEKEVKEPKIPKEPKAPKEPKVPKEPKAGKETQRRSPKVKGTKIEGAMSNSQPGRAGHSPEASEGSEPEGDLGAVDKANNFDVGRGAGRQKSKELAAVASAGKESSNPEGKQSTKSRTKVKVVVGKAANSSAR